MRLLLQFTVNISWFTMISLYHLAFIIINPKLFSNLSFNYFFNLILNQLEFIPHKFFQFALHEISQTKLPILD